MFLKVFLNIFLSWPAALAHGKIEENSVNSGVFKGLGRSRNWTFSDARALKTLQKTWFWTDFKSKKRVNYGVFDWKHCKNTGKKNNVFEGFSYIYVWVGQHGKIEEHSVNSGVFKDLGRQGNWKHCKNEFWNGFYGDKCVNYRVLKENVAKTCTHTHFKKHGIWMILWKKRPCWHWLHVCCCYGTMHCLAIVYCPSLSNFPPLTYVTYKDWLACQQTRSSCSTPPLAPVTNQKKPAVWAATPREAGWICKEQFRKHMQ